MIYDLKLPYAKPPLSMNGRYHWSYVATWKRQIRDDVHKLAIQAKLPKGVEFADITLIVYPPTGQRRDTDNPTYTLKSCTDSLVKYGLVEDDDSTHVKSQCLIGEIRKPGEVHLRIEVSS